MTIPIELITRHQLAIRSPAHEDRVRLVFFVDPSEDLVRTRPAILCARSLGCLMCQAVIDELAEAGISVVDVGLLSRIEVDDVGGAESPAPAPAGGFPQ